MKIVTVNNIIDLIIFTLQSGFLFVTKFQVMNAEELHAELVLIKLSNQQLNMSLSVQCVKLIIVQRVA